MIAVLPDAALGEGDVSYVDGLLVEDRDLETVVYLSHFLDAPAKPGDPIPDGASRRGYEGDSLESNGEITGSRLWLLERAKATTEVLGRAREYSAECIAWMVTDGLASKVEAETDFVRLDDGSKALVLVAIVYAPNERTGRRFGPWLLPIGVS